MEPTIYKPSIYKGTGIYKNGAEGGGGGDISPDIPEEYKEEYTQVEFIKSTSSKIFVEVTNFNTSDIYNIQYYIMAAGESMYISKFLNGFGNENHSGSSYLYVNIYTYYTSTTTNRYNITLGSTTVTPTHQLSINEHKLLINSPNAYIDDNVLSTGLSHTAQTIKSLNIFGVGSGTCKYIAAGIIEILDKLSLQTKLKLVPCLKKSTGKYGFFDSVGLQFYGNFGDTDDIEEFKPN